MCNNTGGSTQLTSIEKMCTITLQPHARSFSVVYPAPAFNYSNEKESYRYDCKLIWIVSLAHFS